MFIKLNGSVINSVSIREITTDPCHVKPFKWRVWAHLTTGDKTNLGTFLDRATAMNVLDGYIFPNIKSGESIDLDAFYEQHEIDTAERVFVMMGDHERRKWIDEHRNLLDTGQSGNEEE